MKRISRYLLAPLTLVYGILLLKTFTLLAFHMQILQVTESTEKVQVEHVDFSEILSSLGIEKNKHLLISQLLCLNT